jgi:hypothetical protein
MLLARVVPTLVREKFCLGIPEIQEKNVVGQHHE